MNFNFDKNGIAKYMLQIEKRINEVRKAEVKILLNNLYELTPKASGRLASNYYCVVNSDVSPYNPNKTTPTLDVPNFTIKDEVNIINETPYIYCVNYGTINQLPQNFIERAIAKSENEFKQAITIIGDTDY